MTGVEIPINAWQQAVIVVLFCLFVLALFGFIRWLLGWVSNLQRQWQDFTEKRERVWQTWLEKQSNASTEAMQSMTAALKELACEVREHDEKTVSRIRAATEVVLRQKPKRTE